MVTSADSTKAELSGPDVEARLLAQLCGDSHGKFPRLVLGLAPSDFGTPRHAIALLAIKVGHGVRLDANQKSLFNQGSAQTPQILAALVDQCQEIERVAPLARAVLDRSERRGREFYQGPRKKALLGEWPEGEAASMVAMELAAFESRLTQLRREIVRIEDSEFRLL